MTLSIEWRTEARADLAGIVGFIAQDSPSAAQRVKSQIEQSLRLAAEHPNYMIVYRLLTTSIEVVSVIHTRRQYP